jgi:hypothetical protein
MGAPPSEGSLGVDAALSLGSALGAGVGANADADMEGFVAAEPTDTATIGVGVGDATVAPRAHATSVSDATQDLVEEPIRATICRWNATGPRAPAPNHCTEAKACVVTVATEA